jgi:hypothetical protein
LRYFVQPIVVFASFSGSILLFMVVLSFLLADPAVVWWCWFAIGALAFGNVLLFAASSSGGCWLPVMGVFVGRFVAPTDLTVCSYQWVLLFQRCFVAPAVFLV